MRLRSLAPLIVLFALGCRPRSDGGGAPEPDAKVEQGPGNDATPEPAAPERPAESVYRSELIRATQGGNAPYLLGQLGPESYAPQGRFEGWIITRVWPGDPELCATGCGVEIGDIILSVNGSKLETPEQLSNALAELDALASIEVTGIRDGEFFERSYAVLPDPALPD